MSHRFKVVRGGPYPHFVTLTIVRWYPVFISGSYFRIILDSIKHLRESRGLLIHAYVIMPTHVHAIITATNDDLSAIVRDFKRFTARSIENQADGDGNRLLCWIFRNSNKDERAQSKVWQDEFHPEVIYTRDRFMQKANYIHDNPIRKGLAKMADHYYYSSFMAFDRAEMDPIDIDWLEW
ncbi:transposase [bacterium]|nr:transposase [bacterium]